MRAKKTNGSAPVKRHSSDKLVRVWMHGPLVQKMRSIGELLGGKDTGGQRLAFEAACKHYIATVAPKEPLT